MIQRRPVRDPRPAAAKARSGVAGFALVAGAVVLAWSIVLQPVIERAPPELAARLAPNSPLVLRRAAEQELLAGRSDNALFLAREALSRAPFDPRALRVVGLLAAEPR